MNEIVNSEDTYFLGHPKGLVTLFLTEMWERMSFYGMRGLLVLFMTREVAEGGMDLNAPEAMAIYGVYGASVYFLCVPGGWIADKIFGAQRTVLYGAIIITLGHYVLAIPSDKTFFIGLVLVSISASVILSHSIPSLEPYAKNVESKPCHLFVNARSLPDLNASVITILCSLMMSFILIII